MHAFRVAVRRFRSAVRVVAVADVEQAKVLDDELRWLSGVLGDVRDPQVLREHLGSSFDTVDGSGVDLAPARVAVFAALEADEASARATLVRTLNGRRYVALLRTVRDWCVAPPFTSAADEPADRLARYVSTAKKDLTRRLRKAGDSADRLHGARKAAKRARYVASFAGDSAGKHGAAIAAHAKALQSGLGDHQDTVLAAAYLARVGAASGGAAALGCGVLWAYEQDRANSLLRRVVD